MFRKHIHDQEIVGYLFHLFNELNPSVLP